MVAVVSGTSLGLTTSSRNILGGGGQVADASVGRSGEQAFVNSATGNLVIQDRDETLTGLGIHASIVRTYNSQGLLDDDNGDNWRLGVHQRLHGLTGTVNTAGSTITKTFGDGAEVVYTYDTTLSRYVSTDGDGAHDSLSWNAGTSEWIWTDGSARNTETYDAAGRLTSSHDADGNGLTYSYTGNRLTQVTDSSSNPQTVYFDYTGNNLTQVRVASNGVTQTLTRYAYDSQGRLSQVKVDLSPESDGITDGNVYVTTYTYDGTSKRVASITQTDGTSVSFTYQEIEGSYRVKTFTDGAGNVTTLNYVTTTAASGGGGSSQTVNANTGVLSTTETSVEEVSVPPYVYVQPGETWASLAARVYGDAGYADALRTALGNPTLAAAQQLTALPAVLIDSTTGATYIRGGTALNTSPVVSSQTDAQGRVLSTTHANGSITTFAYQPLTGALLEQRIHANAATTPVFLQDFATNASGFDAFPSGVASVASGSWVVRNLDDNSNWGPWDSFSTATYDYDSHYTYRAELTFGPELMAGYVAFGLLNTDQTRGLTALISHSVIGTTYKEGTWSSQSLGTASANTTYVVEIETTSTGSTLWVYEKGSSRDDGAHFSTDTTDWGDLQMFVETGADSYTASSVKIDNIGVAAAKGTLVGGQIVSDSPSDTVATVGTSSDAFAVRYGDTWASIATTLYGSSAAGNELQTALGNPTLVNPQKLTGLPSTVTLSVLHSAGYVLNDSGGNTSPVVHTYLDDLGHLVGTLHADGSLTSYETDSAGNLVSRRQHAIAPTLPWIGEDFASGIGGFSTMPAGYMAVSNGALTVGVKGDSSSQGPEDSFHSTLLDFADLPVFRAEVTTADDPLGGYVAFGVINESRHRMFSVLLTGSEIRTTFRDSTVSNVLLGNATAGTTYVVELEASATGVTLYVYAKGSSRSAGYSYQTPFTDWGGMQMFMESYWDGSSPQATVTVDAVSAGPAPGSLVGPWYAQEDAADTVDTFNLAGQDYVVQSGDTWNSIALALYGTSDVADELAAAFGNPTLAPSLPLEDLPQALVDLDAVSSESVAIDLNVAHNTELQEVTTTVPAYYVVQSGDTWSSIAATVYGSSDSALVSALQTATGSPTLTVGLHLTIPLSLTYGGGGGTAGVSTEVTIESPLGLATTMVNDTSGRLLTVKSPAASGGARLETTYAYDTSGNVIRVTEDPTGLNRITSLEYDAQGNLILSRDAAGNTVTRTYSATNQLLTETRYTIADPDGSGSGQPSGALTTRYAYDSHDNLRFVVSHDGRVSESRYNNLGQRTATIAYADAFYDLSGVSATTSLSESQLATWTSARTLTKSERVDYAYDWRGNLSSTTTYTQIDSSGNGVSAGASVTHFVYDQRGQLLQTIDARGDGTPLVPDDYVTSFNYDGLGRIESVTAWEKTGVTRTTSTFYDDANHQIEVTSANGLLETRTYDTAGRLLSVAHSSGAQMLGTTTYDYDDDGRLRRATDPLGVATHFVYDAAGRKQFDVDADGSLTEYVYDDTSNLIKTIQYAGVANSALLVNGSNEPLTSVDVAQLRNSANGNPAANRVTRAVYDSANRLVFTVDAEGAVTETRYDGVSRVTDTVAYATPVSIAAATNLVSVGTVTGLLSPSSNDRHARNLYDNDGHIIGALDAAGYLVELVYDGAGQLTRTIGYANPTPSAQRAAGNLAALRPTADATNDITAYFFYDAQGRRVGTLDGERYLTETVYDAAGNVAQTLRYDVRRTYTAGATLADLRPASLGSSQVRTFSYDGKNQLVSETNPEGTVTSYVYDSVGNLIGTTRAQGTIEARQVQARYDVMGRLIAELTAEGSAALTGGMTQPQIDAVWAQYGVTHQYDLSGRRISTTDQNGNKTLFFYDVDGRLTHTVNALGEVVEQRYNGLNQLTDTITYTNRISTGSLTGGLVNATLTSRLNAAADANKDAKTTLAYTLTGRVHSATTAQGSQVTYSYNAFGNQTGSVQSIDSTHSLTHSYAFNSRGLLETTHWDPAGLNTSEVNEYDAFGRVVASTDANGKTTTFAYDRLGQVITSVDALSSSRSTSYDAFGRVLSMTDAIGNTTTYVYDDTLRSVVVTTPEGISLTTTRNRHGETATVSDGRGNTTTYQYDQNGQLTLTTDSLGELSERTYDKAGRLLTVEDGRDVVTTISYDAANRVFTRSVELDNGEPALTTTYTYDGQGRVTDVTDARGVITHTEYDKDGRVTAVVSDFGSSPHLNLRTEYQYDDVGNVLLVTEGAGSANPRATRYVYDALGRRTSEIADPGSGKLNLTTRYEYDGNGNVVRKIDAKNDSTRFVYDAAGRLIYTVDALGGVTRNGYDAEGRVISVRRYATAVNVASLPATGVTPSVQLEALLASSSLDRVQQTVYDADGRQVFLIDAAGGVTQKDYDDSGNIVRQHIYSERIADGTYTTVASVTSALASVSDNNASNDRDVRMVYDARNRAVFVIDATGAVVRNTYDDVGNLIARTAFANLRTLSDVPDQQTMDEWVGTPAHLDAAHDRTTRFWYDGANRLKYTLDAEGYLTQNNYDGAGNVTSDVSYANPVPVAANADLSDVANAVALIVDVAHDRTITRVYDGAGRLESVTDAESNTESYTYDEVGNRKTMTNKKGDVWTYVYDANHRLLEEHSPVVSITQVSASGGGLTSTTTSASLVTKMTYDALGNLETRTEAFGRVGEERTTAYAYDALGRQVRVDFPPVMVYDPVADAIDRSGTAVVRTETQAFPYSEVTYDTLGNAVMNRDVAGNYSHKVYDQLGRVIYEVDAERYVTQRAYDTFGNQISITRFASKLDDSGITASTVLNAASVSSRLTTNVLQDRKIVSEYDRLNRLSRVIQPTRFYFESLYASSGGQTYSAGATTTFQYDAFGKVVKESRLVSAFDNVWADTYSYYDRRGNVAATVDPLGYVTKFEYDASGNTTRKVEYARALTSAQWSLTDYSLPTANIPQTSVAPPVEGYDRDTRYTYDRLNRKTEERLVNFAHASASNVTAITIEDRITTFGYDAVGNQTRTTDAAGRSTYFYYDVLGRSVATVQPARALGNSTSLTPLTETLRDAFGNLAVQIERANGTSSANATSFTAATPSSADRTSYFKLDGYGHIVATQDATGAVRHASYNVRGDVMKEWQQVHDNAGVISTLVTFYDYDKLGQQISMIEPQDFGSGTPKYVAQITRYNAFGEITGRGFDDPDDGDDTQVYHETFEYDLAGNVWRTNTGDGVYRVYLYNLAGQVTAEIHDPGSNTIRLIGSPASASALTSSIRTNTRYDLAGRVVDQQDPGFYTISRTFVPGAVEPLRVPFSVSTLVVPNNPAAIYRQVFGPNGISFVVDPGASVDQDGGFYFDGTNYVQDPYYELVEFHYLHWNATGSIGDTRTFEYRLASDPDGEWQAMPIDSLANGQLGINVDLLPAGSYEYRVEYTHSGDTEPYTRATGTLELTGALRTEPVVRPDYLDESGTVAPISIVYAPGSASGVEPSLMPVTASVRSSAVIDDSAGASMFYKGANSIEVRFPSVDDHVIVEIEYVTDDAIFSIGAGLVYPKESRTIALYVDDASNAAQGLTLTWFEPAGIQGPGGITSVTNIRVIDRHQQVIMQTGGITKAPTVTTTAAAPTSKITWAAPRNATVEATFEVRLKGSTTWQSLAVVRQYQSYLVDTAALTNGTWEYRVTYTRDSTITARAEGEIDVTGGGYTHDFIDDDDESAPLPPPNPEAVAPILVSEGSEDDIELSYGGYTSAALTVSGGTEYVSGYSQQPVLGWAGTNVVDVAWPALTGPVKVELDYTTREIPTYSSSGSPARWRVSGSQPGIAQSRSFEFASAPDNAVLEWTDSTTNGGIGSVQAVRVYTKDGGGNWVLQYQSSLDPLPHHRVMYWNAPSADAVRVRVEISPLGEDEWQDVSVERIDSLFTVDLSELSGDYDYRITYTGVDSATVGTRILSVATGQLAVPSVGSGDPLEVTQSTLLLPDDMGSVGPVSVSGSTIAWSRAPQVGTTVVVRHRLLGETTWQTSSPQGTAPSYSFDLGAGSVEFEILYYRSSIDAPYARSVGLLNGPPPEPVAKVAESVAPIRGANVGPVTVLSMQSAEVQVTGTPYHLSGHDRDDYFPVPFEWDGTNEVALSWDDLGPGDVRVELDYESYRPGFNYGDTLGIRSDQPHMWSLDPGAVTGFAATKSFEFSNASTGATLSWTEGANTQIGGITRINRVQVFVKNSSGEWVLKYDRDNAAPVPGKSLYWAFPNEGTLRQVFRYKESGSDIWQRLNVALVDTYSTVSLSGLAAGTYDYELTYERNGVPVSVATGAFTLDAVQYGSTIGVSQNNVAFDEGLGPIGLITSDGASITWSRAPDSGDSIVLRSRAQGSVVWTAVAVSGAGPTYTVAVPGAGLAELEFEILYTHSGSSEPYAQATGALNRVVPLRVTASSLQVSQRQTITTEPLPIQPVRNDGQLLSWSTPAETGSTVTFRYRTVESPTWSTLTATWAAGAYKVDPSALPLGTYYYEINYVRSGETEPYAIGTGTMTLHEVRHAGLAEVSDTTEQEGEYVLVLPTPAQQLDRWGNALTVIDARHNTTDYAYNQLNQVVTIKRPLSIVVDTNNGEVTTSTDRPISYNYYDVLGQLIGTRDGNGNVSTAQYNAGGQILNELHADGGEKHYIYDAFGNRVQAEDELGFLTRSEFDKANRLVKTEQELVSGALAAANQANLLTSTYVYDESGRRIRESNDLNETIEYEYDLTDNLVRRITPEGHVTAYDYNERGQKVLETDANGNELSWTEDLFGRVLTSTDLSGIPTQYTYNGAGLLTRKTSGYGQRIDYEYDARGRLIRIVDRSSSSTLQSLAATNKETSYEYDAAGNRTRETVTIDGVIHSDTRLYYDAQGRLSSTVDSLYTVEYFYDGAGNRTRVHATYLDHTRTNQTQDLWYSYDEMNRVTLSQAANTAGHLVIDMNQGVELTYNEAGQRTSSRTWGERIFYFIAFDQQTPGNPPIELYQAHLSFVTNFYGYDGAGRLTTTDQVASINSFGDESDYVLRTNTRVYDGASREISDTNLSVESSALITRVRTTIYDADGRPVTQTTMRNGGLESVVKYGNAFYTPAYYTDVFVGDAVSYYYWTQGYDAAGVLRGYSVDVYDSGFYRYTTTYTYDYIAADTYLQYKESASSWTNVRHGVAPLPAVTTRRYDANLQLVAIADSEKPENNRYFANNSDGQALTVVQGNFEGSGQAAQALRDALLKPDNSTKSQHFFFANGQQLGSFGQLTDANGQFEANFDVNFTPVSQAYPSSVPSQVIAQSGDTLRIVAQRVFGDATLWYLIAEENGLSDPDAPLTEGSSLRIPNEVVSLSNTASSFKPFDVSDAIGDTTPTQAMPPVSKKKGCGVFGMILIIVVVIVVTVLSYGQGTGWAATLGNSIAGGGTGGAVAGGAIAATAGSVVGQAVGIAIGQQDSFNWKAVAAAAISGGVGAGVSAVSTGLSAAGQVAMAGLNSAVSQGVNIALGLQDKFSWGAVAAASAAAPLANAASDSVKDAMAGSFNRSTTDFTAHLASGAVQQLSSVVFNGGRVDYVNLVADAFGNALGNSIVDAQISKAAAAETATVDRLARRGFSGGFDASGYRNSELEAVTLDELGSDSELANNRGAMNPGGVSAMTPDEQRNAGSEALIEEVQITVLRRPDADSLLEEVVVTAQGPTDAQKAAMLRRADLFDALQTISRSGRASTKNVRIFDADAIRYQRGGHGGLVREGSDFAAKERLRGQLAVAEDFNRGEAQLIASFADNVSPKDKLLAAISIGGGYFTEEVGQNLLDQINLGNEALDLTYVRGQSEAYLQQRISDSGLYEQIAASFAGLDVPVATIDSAFGQQIDLWRTADPLLPGRLSIGEPGVDRSIEWAVRMAALAGGAAELLAVAPLMFLRGAAVRGWPGVGGSGPVSGTIGITDRTSVGALRNYRPKGGVEFVYDPSTNTFVVGRPLRGLFDGSPHEQLARSIGAYDRPVVGGTFNRGLNGEVITTEQSGHYGPNWTDATRQQFQSWLSDRLGLVVEHGAWNP